MDVCPESVINKCIQIPQPTSSNPTWNQSSLSTKCASLTLSCLIQTSVEILPYRTTTWCFFFFYFNIVRLVFSKKKSLSSYNDSTMLIKVSNSQSHRSITWHHKGTLSLRNFYFPKIHKQENCLSTHEGKAKLLIRVPGRVNPQMFWSSH